MVDKSSGRSQEEEDTMHKLMEEKIRLRAEVAVKTSQIAGFER